MSDWSQRLTGLLTEGHGLSRPWVTVLLRVGSAVRERCGASAVGHVRVLSAPEEAWGSSMRFVRRPRLAADVGAGSMPLFFSMAVVTAATTGVAIEAASKHPRGTK